MTYWLMRLIPSVNEDKQVSECLIDGVDFLVGNNYKVDTFESRPNGDMGEIKDDYFFITS